MTRSALLQRIALYAFLLTAAAIFGLPLYVMVATSLKSMPELRETGIFALPRALDPSAWRMAWTGACTGLTCGGISPGFWNSVKIVVPSVGLTVLAGALNGYAMTFWKPPLSGLLLGLMVLGAFLPHQIFLYPLVQWLSAIGIYQTLPAIIVIHCIFGIPLMTLLFRGYYSGLPRQLFLAAQIDGAGFWRIFLCIMLPLAAPVTVVAVILQSTAIWNDFLLGLVFAGRENLPMTVQLNNIVNTVTGERDYTVDMAATVLTALVPLAIFLLSGRWFVRGITAGAVKG
ncbi:carbohydrate ABC transporter permease [Poseidonocella sp. HB161398]|uniref:carbohydrate ABC transporter permease n=1 Tax=Poseidonocella sp. HB161398 TaxID=2320855 RepID=UPI001108C7C0|nr:carbohydrate ABC transporter permease [Poseidonocella sp. HB161398]